MPPSCEIAERGMRFKDYPEAINVEFPFEDLYFVIPEPSGGYQIGLETVTATHFLTKLLRHAERTKDQSHDELVADALEEACNEIKVVRCSHDEVKVIILKFNPGELLIGTFYGRRNLVFVNQSVLNETVRSLAPEITLPVAARRFSDGDWLSSYIEGIRGEMLSLTKRLRRDDRGY